MQTVLLLLLHLYLLLPLHLLHLRLALRLSLQLHLLASHRLRTFPLSLGAHLSLLLRPLRRSRLNSRRLSLSRLLLLLHLRLVLRAHLRRDAPRPGVGRLQHEPLGDAVVHWLAAVLQLLLLLAGLGGATHLQHVL